MSADRRDVPAIAVDGLSKTYSSSDGSEIVAVDGVSFEIESGTVVGILGPNGAGKTTTIKSLLGLIQPTGGTVSIAGIDVHGGDKALYRQASAVLEGARNVYWRLTVRENIEFFSRIQGINPRNHWDEYADLLDRLNLSEKHDELVKSLSRGMKQKVALACTLVRDTPILFLDEPTLGLDVETSQQLQVELRRLVEEEDRTIVLSSHDMDVVQSVCDRVIIMNRGRIVTDAEVEELLDIFRSQTIEWTLADDVTDEERERLRNEFDAHNWETTGDQVRFEVVLTDATFHDLTRTLADLDVTVSSVSTVEPDLEEIFVNVTESDASRTEGATTEVPEVEG